MYDLFHDLLNIPKGKVTTYKCLAKQLNLHPRAVGKLLNKNPDAPRVPCHRVIQSDGKLGGYAHGVAKKIALLESEGVQINKGKIDLKKFGYDF